MECESCEGTGRDFYSCCGVDMRGKDFDLCKCGEHTGRGNYILAQQRTNIECVKYPELLSLPNCGATTSGAYWATEGLNALADSNNFDKITLHINGGMNGSEDRHSRWTAILAAI